MGWAMRGMMLPDMAQYGMGNEGHDVTRYGAIWDDRWAMRGMMLPPQFNMAPYGMGNEEHDVTRYGAIWDGQ